MAIYFTLKHFFSLHFHFFCFIQRLEADLATERDRRLQAENAQEMDKLTMSNLQQELDKEKRTLHALESEMESKLQQLQSALEFEKLKNNDYNRCVPSEFDCVYPF